MNIFFWFMFYRKSITVKNTLLTLNKMTFIIKQDLINKKLGCPN